MHVRRLDRLVAGTALALVLAAPGGLARAETIEQAYPITEPYEIPSLTPADVAPAAQAVPAPAAPAVAAPKSEPAPVAATPKVQEAAPASQPTAAAAAPATAAPATAAPAAAAAPPPAQAAAPTPSPVAEALREMLSSPKLARLIDRKPERTAIEAFYAAHDYASLWVEDGAPGARAKAAAAYLATVDADGFEPSDYPVPSFRAGAEPAALAEAEIRMTATLLTFARHAETGRVHYSRISADIGYKETPLEPAEMLARIAGAPDVAKALDSFQPQQPGYKALKAKLAEIRAGKGEAAPVRIATGPTLKVTKAGTQDPRVPLLRQRLNVAGEPDNTTYDKPLADAVAKFQKERGLSANGHLNNATVEAMNGPRRDRDADIILANLERWRWLPRDLGKTHVMLNIPDYSLKVVNNGAVVWTTKVVVGKPSTPTPILSETMKYITVNPTWNVPPSIVQNEYLPALAQDPTVLERMGLKLTQNRDGTVHISQPPGERNALGRIRFNFPNKFLVYQHDTPDKHLFAHERRAYSHGCMRVFNPIKYGEVLLGIALPKEGYTEDRLRKMFGNAEININLPTPIPVHITYQTAFVDDAGKLVIRDDIYGRDSRVMAALKGEERKVADVAIERRSTTPTAPVRAQVRYNSYAGDSGPSFFERLFGGGPPPAPPAPMGRRNYIR